MTGVYTCPILDNKRLAESVYAVAVSCPDIAGIARAGQFVSIRCGGERLLRRPVSICSKEGSVLRFVFESKGEGTTWLSRRMPGESIDILGPLGNGFVIPGGSFIVVGGGIGSPPLLFAAESSRGAASAVLGFRDSRKVILKSEFEAVCREVIVSTDDGSGGVKGTVAAPLAELLGNGGFDAVLACGPRAMLSAVADVCLQHGVPCQVSLEERMGCGVGACAVCACATVKDGLDWMSRVCKDGPVFDAGEVAWV